jgi:predicted PurR-regulated permease PerM
LEREDGRRRTLYLTVVGAVVLWLAYMARDAVVPLLVALLLAYVLAPLVAVLEKRGFSRIGAVTALFVSFFGSVGLAAALGLPPLLLEGRKLVLSATGEPAITLGTPLPAKVRPLLDRPVPATLEEFLAARESVSEAEATAEERGARASWERKVLDLREGRGEEAVREYRQARAGWLVGRYRERVIAWEDRERDGRFRPGYVFDATLLASGWAREKFPASAVAESVEDLGVDALPRLAEALYLSGGDVARGALDVLGTFLRVVGWLLIVPLYTFFFLMRLEDVWAAFVAYLPGTYRERVLKVLLAIHRMLIGFFRGRVLTMVLKAVYVGVLLGLVGAPFWPVFGALAGLLTIVPAVGPLVAAVPSIALSFADRGEVTAALSIAVFVSAEFVEGYILIPKLIGKEVGLHPMAVITAILVGAGLLGVFGVVIAIPMAAAAKIVWVEFVLPAAKAKAAEAPPRKPVA